MLALLNRANHPAHILSVFYDGVTFRKIFDRNLVADRNVCLGSKTEIGVVVRDNTEHISSCRQTLNDDDANIVFMVVDQQVGLTHNLISILEVIALSSQLMVSR